MRKILLLGLNSPFHDNLFRNVTGNETVQVFSEMPSIIGEFTSNFGNGIDIGNKNIYNNSAFVELLNATFPYSEKSVNLSSHLYS
jgi:hypothetical protein